MSGWWLTKEGHVCETRPHKDCTNIIALDACMTLWHVQHSCFWKLCLGILLLMHGCPSYSLHKSFSQGTVCCYRLCLDAVCNAWMKHAMTRSWVIAPAPVACMTCLSGKVNFSVQVGIVLVRTHTLSLMQGHTTTNQLYWIFDRCETSIDYSTPTFMFSMDFDCLSRQSNKRTLMRAKICCQAIAGCWESWGTPSRSWHCETIAVWPQCRGKLRGGKQTRIHRRVLYNDNNMKPSVVKAAQNKIPSDGLVRVAKACRHLFFPRPISILQVHEKQGATSWGLKGAGWVVRWQALLVAVNVNLGRLDSRRGRVNCLAHCRKQNQTLNWFSQSTKFERCGAVFDMNAIHKLTGCKKWSLCSIFVTSLLKMFQSKMIKILFEVSTDALL